MCMQCMSGLVPKPLYSLIHSPQITPHAKLTHTGTKNKKINLVWPDGSSSILQPKRWAPNPKGSLSLAIPLGAINVFTANGEVTNSDKKCGTYEKYSPEERRQIGCYACNWQKPHVVSQDDVNKMSVRLLYGLSLQEELRREFQTEESGIQFLIASSSFLIATAYLSLMFVGSLLQDRASPTAVDHMCQEM